MSSIIFLLLLGFFCFWGAFAAVICCFLSQQQTSFTRVFQGRRRGKRRWDTKKHYREGLSINKIWRPISSSPFSPPPLPRHELFYILGKFTFYMQIFVTKYFLPTYLLGGGGRGQGREGLS